MMKKALTKYIHGLVSLRKIDLFWLKNRSIFVDNRVWYAIINIQTSHSQIFRKVEWSMTKISVTELKTNAGKYVEMAQEADVLITKNGKLVAKLVTAKPDKKEVFKHLLSLYPDDGLNIDPEDVRRERLG
jgi:prevent-host-death family protein